MNSQFQKILQRPLVAIGVIVVVFIIGYFVGGQGGQGVNHAGHDEGGSDAATSWTCSMHPQVQQPEFGQCPLCGMDLIPAGTSEPGSPRELKLSAAAQKLAEIETTTVKRQPAAVELRLAGKIAYDETSVAAISAWVPGRIDSLFVDFTGVEVSEGDPMALIYSPQLLTAQEELIQAFATTGASGASSGSGYRATLESNLEAARTKLRLLGLTSSQIAAIESSGQPSDHLILHAPMGGVVIEKQAVAGKYLQTGSPIYTIADLSHVWAQLEAYETDLAWIKKGQQVEIQTSAYPGRYFRGQVEFIDPVLNDRLRTVTIRVDVPNAEYLLKPGMLAYGTIAARVNEQGIADADTLSMRDPLTIPASAPLRTGKRSVVYVANAGETGHYTGREVILGPRVGDAYVILEGLSEGEQVVSKGNFKIDSAIQITAGFSMMNPEEQVKPTREIPYHGLTAPEKPFAVMEHFITSLSPAYHAYFKLQTAFSVDQVDTNAAITLAKTVNRVAAPHGPPEAMEFWEKISAYLSGYAESIAETSDLTMARELFEPVSKSMMLIVEGFGSTTEKPIIKFHCPMAFDWRGADWLQDHSGVENPYFGSQMYKCGSELNSLWDGGRQHGHN
jgi:membrane fusion protein, copper/silver efflux system